MEPEKQDREKFFNRIAFLSEAEHARTASYLHDEIMMVTEAVEV